jgi:hypothetical protein
MAEEQPERRRRCRALGCGKVHVEGAVLALCGAGRTLKARRWRQGARGGARTWIRISLAARCVDLNFDLDKSDDGKAERRVAGVKAHVKGARLPSLQGNRRRVAARIGGWLAAAPLSGGGQPQPSTPFCECLRGICTLPALERSQMPGRRG